MTRFTGSAGGCTMDNVPEGGYYIRVSAENYETHEGTIIVSSETDQITITLTEE